MPPHCRDVGPIPSLYARFACPSRTMTLTFDGEHGRAKDLNKGFEVPAQLPVESKTGRRVSLNEDIEKSKPASDKTVSAASSVDDARRSSSRPNWIKKLGKSVSGLTARSNQSSDGDSDPEKSKKTNNKDLARSPSSMSSANSDMTQKIYRKQQTGLSAISYSSWRSNPTTSDINTNKDYPSENHRNDAMKTLHTGTREIVNIDSYVADALQAGERSIHFSHHEIAVAPHVVNAKKGCQPNRVRTAKFTTATWLPLSLYWQFKRVANVYFLVVAIIVLGLGSWSPKDWKSKCFPFAGVLLWTALKDLYEDQRRKKDDHLENTSQCLRFDPGSKEWVSMDWQDLLVGDVLFVQDNDIFPADLLLLGTEGCKNAFISTMSLDGETTLKKRTVPQIVTKLTSLRALSSPDIQEDKISMEQAMAKSLLYFFHVSLLTIQLAPPTISLWDFKGKLSSAEVKGDPLPLSEASFLPRGCKLRNTPWALAVVTFIGEETKTRLNSSKSLPKFSQMQLALNTCVWGLLIGLFVVCMYSATLSVIVNDTGSVCCDEGSWVIMFLKYIVTYYHIVPLSLYVCFEMLKLLLGWMINVDKQMIDPVTEEWAVARTADLVEEMGQVSFVFTDKTGTLTANEMVFARASINGEDLDDFRAGDKDEADGVRKCKAILKSGDRSRKEPVELMFKCLALCNAVQVAEREDGTLIYSGMSPDEIALVQSAHDVGIVFDCREASPVCSSCIRIKGLAEDYIRFDILYELEFNSDRKRMSVLVMRDGEVLCITKGADSVMKTLLTKPLGDAEEEHLMKFSKMGLRTLVVAYKKISFLDFKAWEKDYLATQGILDDTRDAKVQKMQADMETSMEYVGITAVEDRLQDGVPEAIERIKQASLRVWMLTGDKTETAVDIARSCNLFNSDTTIAYATDCTTVAEAQAMLQKARSKLTGAGNGGLVLDGMTITEALQDETCKALIVELGLSSRSCVCCRLSPKQKRSLVELVVARSKGVVALAIGDGANDVPMLEGAHIGIGIRGKEGAQAVQVADIAISQFRFLVPLLFCHGRRSYWRSALFLNYYLYKSLALAMCDLIWMHQNEFKGGIAFPEWLSVNYNVFFTSLHVVFALAFDYGVSDDQSLSDPVMYKVGPARGRFNAQVFCLWMVHGVVHGSCSWLIPNLWFGGTYYDKETSKGPAEDFWVASVASFFVIVTVVILKLILEVQRAQALTCWAPSLGAVLSLFFVMGVLGYTGIGLSFQPNMENIPELLFTRNDARLAIVASIAASLALDLLENGVVFMTCRKRSIM